MLYFDRYVMKVAGVSIVAPLCYAHSRGDFFIIEWCVGTTSCKDTALHNSILD